MTPQNVHIVLINWNSLADTRRCLRALRVLTEKPGHIWVVDNHSTDGSADALEPWIARSGLPATLLRNAENLGFGGGCNVGIRQALQMGAEAVWLLNNDAIVDKHALSALIAELQRDPQVGAVGSVIYDLEHPQSVQVWGGGRVIRWAGLGHHATKALPTARLDYLMGASILLRQEALAQVGLFDAARYFMYWEDTDLCFRLRAQGWKLAVAEGSRIWHQHSSSLGHDNPLKDYYVTTSARYFLSSYSRRPRLALAIGSLSRMLKRLRCGQWANIRAIREGWRGLPYTHQSLMHVPLPQTERRRTVRVAVEATTLQGRPAGIGHFGEELTRALSTDPAINLAYFTTTGCSSTPPHPAGLRIPQRSDWKKKIPLGRELQFILQGWQLERLKRHCRPEVILGTNYVLPRSRSPQVLVVHDLSHLRNPETHPPGRVHFLNRHLRPALERASAVITISHFSEQELLHFYPELAGRIHVVYPGIADRFGCSVSEDTRRSLRVALDGDSRSYFLFLSTLEPRKNLERLLLAYEGLPERIKRAHPLVLVGQMGWQESSFAPTLERLQAKGEILLTGYLRDELLPALFERAVALLYPSLYEGFGLPPIEAMGCGCPVLASNVTAIPEVCGDAALYCDPLDVESIRAGILRLAEDEELRSGLSEKGRDQAAKYNWQKAGEQILRIVREVAGRG
ncbi:MAG: glycosyltransferase [Acidithiobacillus sp.]